MKKRTKASVSVSVMFADETCGLNALANEQVKKELISVLVYYAGGKLCMNAEFESSFGVYIFGEIVGRQY